VKVAVAAMPAPQRRGVEWAAATRKRSQAAEAAKAEAAAKTGTPRWVAVPEAAIGWSFQAALEATEEEAAAMRLQRCQEEATVVGRSRPYRAESVAAAAGWVAVGSLLAAQFPCRCSR
jgi:hypothetical protein